MFKYILEGAGNINWMAIASLLTFMAVFLVSAMMAFRSKPAFIDKMANMPLDDSIPSFNAENDRHEK
ncbi:hypothetical protein [Phaeodactylibacter sp.]|jgi:hypothetical protein|uniref:hypothetical protein n=1 Tax=Phaeodactylibacter sp. TaxID=1940289 RepID=UPI0025D5700B|nr:hypothetical protein [Phaeodactylibacter sp.]MCI4649166.1 hypothetical protein [Phaeodactylibacter sp.]MCI5090396.1 hypothetical protein [Phaeodactylibacter sp.]